MAGIIDVARLANVSTATVSRVISNQGNVKEDTKKKVIEAIDQLHYQPNVLARQLRRMQTTTVLVVVPDITNPFFSKILRGIESVAVENGYQVLLGDTQNNVEREREYIDLLRQKQADGMILLTARSEPDVINQIAEKYPVVLACEYLDDSALPTVSIDNVLSAKKATCHLIHLGHRRIGYLSGPPETILSRDRLNGFKEAMAEHALAVKTEDVLTGDFSFESGYQLTLTWLDQTSTSHNKPTAIFAANDDMAIGALKAVKSRGLSVPEDMAIVGFDNIMTASIVEPALTTIAQPMFEIGTRAMQILLQWIQGERPIISKEILSDELIVRDSCGYR